MIEQLCVIDTETGGLDPALHSILSLGAVVWRAGQIVETFEIYIMEPNLSVEPEAMAINKIDLHEHREKACPPSLAVARFHEFLGRHFDLTDGKRIILAGHNVAFDVSFLRRLYRFAQADYSSVFSHRTLDTASVVIFLALAARLPISEASTKEVFAHFNIQFDAAARHTALGDAIATAQLINNLLELTTGA